MLRLAKILSIFPFTVNVFGKKRDLIVKLGDFVYSESKLEKIAIDDQAVDFSGSPFFKIWAYATINFERDFTASALGIYMKKHLQKGSRFVDIGANLGGYSRLAKKLNCQVDWFEPVPELGAVLSKNAGFFGTPHPFALSNEKGELTFYTSSANIGGSSLVRSNSNEDSGYDGEVKVRVDTFDSVFSEEINQKERFHLVKIDVEGNELKVVEGMQKALSLGLIEAIWCEVRGWGSDRNPGTYKSVSEVLQKLGYAPYEYSGESLTPYNFTEVSNAPQFFDLIYLKT